MPALERYVEETHVPDSTVIWRYMRFDRFVEMIDSHGIWFSRPFAFEDRWEGLFPPSYVRRTRAYAEAEGISFADFELDFRKRANRHRHGCFVNCWHMSENESDGMWKLYGKDRKAIAIRSTIGSINHGLRPDGSGQVIYYDPSHDILSRTLFGAHDILFKRDDFAWEREYRFWKVDDELFVRNESGHDIDESSLTPGLLVNIGATEEWMHAIVVAPGSSDAFIDEVREACRSRRRNWMGKLIVRSRSDRLWHEFTE